MLTESGIVRSDITKSYGFGSATAAGVPLVMKLRVLDIRNGAKPLPGTAVYVWQCDMEGRYSLYSEGATGENYLRGVQETDTDGVVSFTSIYPAAYPGRWPHVHFEVYESVVKATTGAGRIRTSQLALPAESNSLVYASKGYGRSAETTRGTTLEEDGVFSDGYSLQLATVTGTVAGGLTAALMTGQGSIRIISRVLATLDAAIAETGVSVILTHHHRKKSGNQSRRRRASGRRRADRRRSAE